DSAQTQAAGAESQTETQTGSTQAQPSPTAADEAQGEGKTTATQTASRLLPLWIAAALLTVGVLPVRRRVILRARVKKTHGSDANRNAVALWDYFQALSRRYPVALPEVCERLAKKAAFSQHRLTQEEVQTLLTAARNAAEQVQEGLNAWGRFVFRFLYVLDWLDSVDP
ncbi:MAG: hypothetical protein H6Q60_1304, partial [Oscillospiraceae bacterium]|nr:hypothetical protein [Oscillospiraceae bacterium]